MIFRPRGKRLLAAPLSLAIVWPITAHAYDNHFDYTSFETGFGQSQFDVLNYPSINGNYMMTSTDNHRPEMVANNNNLAQFYNNFLADYNTQAQTGTIDAVAEADAIQAYSIKNSNKNGPRPTWLILNELSSSLWQQNPGPPSNTVYRQWVIDCVTRLHDTYGFTVVTYSPYASLGTTANAASWQALYAKSYIGVENYLSGQEVMSGGTDYASRLSWAQTQYQASKTTYGAVGIPASGLFLGEHFANTVAGTGWGRAGIAASDWDTVLQIRQDAIKNVGFGSFLAYSWGGNGMGITTAEQIQHEYWYRTRLVLAGQQPQWLPDGAYNVNGTDIPLSWGQELNWLGGIPNASDAIANFFRTNTAARTVTLDGSYTVSTLSFNSPTSYTITPGNGGTLTLTGTGANITVPQGTHTIAAPLVIGADATIDVTGALSLAAGLSDSAARTITRTGNGTLTIAGTQTYAAATLFNANSGTTNLNSDGGVNLTVNANAAVNFGSSQNLAALTIASGKLATLTAGGAKTLNVGTLSVTGKLNLNDNDAIVRSAASVGDWNGSAYTGVTGSIASGRNGGAWNGSSGIITTSATGTLTGLGVANAADIGFTSTALWNGQTVSSSDTLVMYTYGGDANLDGKLNIDDYTRIDQGIAGGATGWSNGDFNYDGKVNIDDYVIIDSNISSQGPPLGSAPGIGGSVTAIPEPATAVVTVLAGLLGQRRRKRTA
jgi:hypothetical protein